MGEAEWAFSVFWLYTILVDETQHGISSRALLRKLELSGIQARPLWQLVHFSAAHKGAYATDCSVAEHLKPVALSLPSSVGLTQSEQQRVIDSLGKTKNGGLVVFL